MNTEATVLHIRRATVLDAVNILRLVLDEEKRANIPAVHSAAARLTDIVVAIETGYVSVAVVSGRIVGSIGALLSDPSAKQVLIGAFFALSPSFHDTELGSALLSGLRREAAKNSLPIKFMLPVDAVAADYLDGFEAKMVVWGWEPGNADAGAEDSGRDAIAGSGDADLVAPDPDAGADGEAPSGDSDEQHPAA